MTPELHEVLFSRGDRSCAIFLNQGETIASRSVQLHLLISLCKMHCNIYIYNFCRNYAKFLLISDTGRGSREARKRN